MVHGGARSSGTPGCRSSHPLQWGHLCLPSAAGHDDHDVVCRGGTPGGQRGEDPGSEEAQEKSGVGLGLGVGPVAPQVVSAWPYGLQGSR